MFIDKSLQFFKMAPQSLSFTGQLSSWLKIVSLARLRFAVVLSLVVILCFLCLIMSLYAMAWVMVESLAPFMLNSGVAMKSVLVWMSATVPVAASLSASTFPLMSVCPLTHSKEVHLPLFLSLFTISLMRLAWAIFMKFESKFLVFSQTALIAQHELVLMWSQLELGTAVRALWIARISTELLVCGMFWPTGAAMLCGSPGPNHTPIPVWALILPFLMHDSSVWTTMSSGSTWGVSLLAW